MDALEGHSRPAICYLRINHYAQIFLTRPSVWSCERHGCHPLAKIPADLSDAGSWEALFSLPKKGTRGGILGGNPDRSLKSFPPCYSQTSLLTNTPLLQFSWTWYFYSFALWFLQQQLGRGGGKSGLLSTCKQLPGKQIIYCSHEIWTQVFSFESQCFHHWTIEDICNKQNNLYKHNTTINIGIFNIWIVLQNLCRN